MLQITMPFVELFDEQTNSFAAVKEQVLQLEHSLVSVSKWESIWKKPFLSKDKKTYDESVDYIRCMTLTQNVDPRIYISVPNSIIAQITNYIEDPMTATTFSKQNTPPNREVITSEIIYYWMITLNIPLECQKWHLNRLLTLINVCNLKNQKPKKMTPRQLYMKQHALNEARKSQLHTQG